MTWLAATLVACAVFVALRPDPGLRLAAVIGVSRTSVLGSSIREVVESTLGKKRRRQEVRKGAIAALGNLAADLSSGMPQQQALIATGEGIWPAACAAVRLNGDIASALRQDSLRVPMLAPLAACWAVSENQGSGLAISVTRMTEQARIAEDIRVQLEAQLAGPRATARILMLLPAFGIAMGMLMGVNPLGWLLGTLPGLMCLFAGLSLAGLGYWWTSRIVSRVEALL